MAIPQNERDAFVKFFFDDGLMPDDILAQQKNLGLLPDAAQRLTNNYAEFLGEMDPDTLQKGFMSGQGMNATQAQQASSSFLGNDTAGFQNPFNQPTIAENALQFAPQTPTNLAQQGAQPVVGNTASAGSPAVQDDYTFQNNQFAQPQTVGSTSGMAFTNPMEQVQGGGLESMFTGINNVDGTETLSGNGTLASATSSNLAQPQGGSGLENFIGDNANTLNLGLGLGQFGLGMYTGLKGLDITENYMNEQLAMQREQNQLAKDSYNNTVRGANYTSGRQTYKEV